MLLSYTGKTLSFIYYSVPCLPLILQRKLQAVRSWTDSVLYNACIIVFLWEIEMSNATRDDDLRQLLQVLKIEPCTFEAHLFFNVVSAVSVIVLHVPHTILLLLLPTMLQGEEACRKI